MIVNRRRLGTSGSRSRILLAVVFLLALGIVALIPGSGPSHLLAGKGNANSRPQSSNSNRPAPTSASPSALASYGHLPLIFEPNQGQTDPQVKFLARGGGYGLYLTSHEAVLALHASAARSRHAAAKNSPPSVVTMSLAGANPAAESMGSDPLPGKSNYFIGNDPAQWHRDIPQFARVEYRGVYPGIDLVYYGNQGRLEYDFNVAPGSDPTQVALKFQGLQNLAVDGSGDLVLSASSGDLRLHAPRVYQKFGDEERAVPGRFDLRGNNAAAEVGFVVGDYDRSRTLVIDPVLTFSTYLGGSGIESCSAITGLPFTPGCPAIAVDTALNAYVAGSTTSTDFPGVNASSFQSTLKGLANIFIVKFNPTGNTVAYSTYIGGNGTDYTAGVAVDAGFNVVVAGTTSSSDFPTKGGFQTAPGTAHNHVFVSKLDTQGQTLLYSTYLAGNGIDIASGVALDPGGNVYVTGTTTSTNVPNASTAFPATLGAFQTAPASGSAIQFFMSKLATGLTGFSSLAYSTYFGGGNPTNGQAVGGGIAVDANNNVYITGGTNFLHVGAANDFPILNPYQGCLDTAPLSTTGPQTCAPDVTALDVFAAKLSPTAATGAQLIYSTYLGGSSDDIGYGITVDSSLNAYITGSTTSTDFSFNSVTGTTVFQGTNGGGIDAFMVKIGNPSTTTNGGVTTTNAVPLDYFTYIGGSGTDTGTGIGVDSASGARVVGWTDSPNFPVLNDPIQANFGGGQSDAFVARIDTTATEANAPGHYATYLGGNGNDYGTGIAVDPVGASYVTGETSSTNFLLLNPFRGALSGSSDAFVTKLGPSLDLSLAVVATPLQVGVGNQVSFAYTITNNGDFVTGVTFVDTLPTAAAQFVSATVSQSTGSCGSAVGGFVTCGIGSLDSAGTATITIVVTPNAPTTPSTSPTILGNSATVSVQGAQLTSIGTSVTVNDFTLKVGPNTQTVVAGVPGVYTATLTPTGNIPDTVSLSCTSGLPTGSTCQVTTNPIPNLSNGPASTVMVINTTARVTTTTRLWRKGGALAPLYASLLPISGLALFGAGVGRKRRKAGRKSGIILGLIFGALLSLVAFQAGCSSTSTTNVTGTPAGTYIVTISAVTGSATRTETVTLLVQ